MKSVITANTDLFIYTPNVFPRGVRIDINNYIPRFFVADHASDAEHAAELTAGTFENVAEFDLDLGNEDAAHNLSIVAAAKDDVRAFARYEGGRCFLFESARIHRNGNVFTLAARKVLNISEDYFLNITGMNDDLINFEAQIAAHFVMDRIFKAAKQHKQRH